MKISLSARSVRLAVWATLLACGCSSNDMSTAALSPAAGASGQSPAAVSGGVTGGVAGTGSAGTTVSTTAGTHAPAIGSAGAAGTGVAGQSTPAANGGSAAPAAGSGGGSAGAPAGGSGGMGAPVGGAPGTAGSPATSAWPAITDFGMKGSFKPITKTNSGPMNAYTLFYPEELGRDGLKHPVITWGNGATSTPDQFTLLPLLASQGFFVIAANDSFVTSAEMKSGIDWAGTENDRMGGDFFQKLDLTKVASMGWSLGSLGTFELASDPRIVTTVHISGGAMDKSVLPNLKHPAAFFCGDSSDIAHDNCESDFTMATVPVFYGVFPGDHFGIESTMFAPQINSAAAAWLRWRLMGDASVAPKFVGPDCGLCKDKSWTVKQKQFDTAPP
jgi:hypothetical protein